MLVYGACSLAECNKLLQLKNCYTFYSKWYTITNTLG